MDDDEQFIGMLIMSALVGVVLGILIGSGHATSRIYDRIYDRCLEDNSLMIYQDAAAKCKKIVGDEQ